MAVTAPTLENLVLNVTNEIHVQASLESTFDALLEEMSVSNQTPDGKPMPMVIEPRPGGRWYRDLGEENGHFWGHVQAIKRPTLLEITGPLFMSAPVVSNVQYRLEKVANGTVIRFRHSAFGFVPDEFRTGLTGGWTALFERVRQNAESKSGRA